VRAFYLGSLADSIVLERIGYGCNDLRAFRPRKLHCASRLLLSEHWRGGDEGLIIVSQQVELAQLAAEALGIGFRSKLLQ